MKNGKCDPRANEVVKKTFVFSRAALGQTPRRARPRRGYVSLIKGTMKLRLDKKFLRNPLRKYAFEAIVNDSPAVFLSRTFLHGLRFLS